MRAYSRPILVLALAVVVACLAFLWHSEIHSLAFKETALETELRLQNEALRKQLADALRASLSTAGIATNNGQLSHEDAGKLAAAIDAYTVQSKTSERNAHAQGQNEIWVALIAMFGTAMVAGASIIVAIIGFQGIRETLHQHGNMLDKVENHVNSMNAKLSAAKDKAVAELADNMRNQAHKEGFASGFAQGERSE